MKKQITLFGLLLILLLSIGLCACEMTPQDPNTSTTEWTSTASPDEPAPHEHSFGAWAQTTLPSCTQKGEETRACTICLEMETREVAMLPHSVVTDLAVEPTCTKTGLTEGSHCSVCSKVLVAQETVEKKAHTVVIDQAVEATCSVAGLTEGSHCSVCNEILVAQETIEKKAHISVIDQAVEATCTATGLTEGSHCSVCNKVLVTQQTVGKKDHTSVIDQAVEATCTETGLTEGSHCSVCSKVLIAQQKVGKKDHTTVIDQAIGATCTETGLTEGSHCSVCNKVLVVQEVVDAKGHSIVVDEMIRPLGDRTGLTEGKHCSVCSVVLVVQEVIPATGYTNPILYSDDYGYTYLGTMTNGEAMQQLYDLIDVAAISFHVNTTQNADSNNVVAAFDFGFLHLTENEALSVWVTYKNDHPLYYWISTSVSIAGTELLLLTEDEYANGADRAVYNELIYDAVKSYTEAVNAETSSYRIALAFHDAIIYAIDYAYEADGMTPQDDIWAHSILGVFEKQSGVCESYARTFQLLLNFCGVENIFVTGQGNGEEHAWNLVQMDDGNWYWFDLTWDDRLFDQGGLTWEWGICYNYFCVNDMQNVNWKDGGWEGAIALFLDQHTVALPTYEGVNFLYALPTRSTTTFAESDLLLRDTFIVDGLKYAVAGYNAVQLVEILIDGDIVIPETVTYDGVTYEVISIGAMNGTLFDTWEIADINNRNITSITIPKSVIFIWDYAFRFSTLENIWVDENNPYFCSKDGVLFTKSLYTLIQYPFANARTEYTIPAETVDIADQAVGGRYLNKLVIGKNVSGVGQVNWGFGYRDEAPTGWFGGNYIGDAWTHLCSSLNGNIVIDQQNPNYCSDDFAIYDRDKTYIIYIFDQTITTFEIPANMINVNAQAFAYCSLLESFTVADGNSYYSAYDGVLYNKQMTEMICVPSALKGDITVPQGVTVIGSTENTVGVGFGDRKNITSVILPEGLTTIGNNAFTGCTNLKTVLLPNTVIYIGNNAFWECSSLESIDLPPNLTYIGSHAFHYTPYYNDEGNWQDGVLYIGNYLISVKQDYTGTFTVKAGTRGIAGHAFGATGITEISIPDSVIFIGDQAFNNCAISHITIPDSVTTIGAGAFVYSQHLTSIVISNNVTELASYIFYGCSKLESVVIGSGVTTIYYNAFAECDNLSSVFYVGTEEAWKAIAIESSNTSLLNATVYFYSETEPTEKGNYWHYDANGEVAVW